MNQPRIFILTAVHSDLRFTAELLESVAKQTYKNIETYLVDDGSTDGTSQFVNDKYPRIKILKGDGNLWWTASINLGIEDILKKAGNKDYIWIINNDCVFSADTIKKIVDYADKSKRDKSIIGSVVINKTNNKVCDCGVLINWENIEFKILDDLKSQKEADAISTKGTLFPVSVFKKLGLFDAKHFPQYFSDYEFTIRAKRNGYHLKICPEVRIYNDTQRTGTEKTSEGKISPGYSIKVGFSKKSKFNVLTQINIIKYVCPTEYRIKNYMLLLKKIVVRTLGITYS